MSKEGRIDLIQQRRNTPLKLPQARDANKWVVLHSTGKKPCSFGSLASTHSTTWIRADIL
jgi:hypothetical protein